jgi:ribosomal protein L3 glutamine methyltransferase
MWADARGGLRTVRDLMRFAVSRFDEARLAFGHGSDNAWDEAAYLILKTLHLPLDRLDPFLDARLTRSEVERVLDVLRRRVEERIPAAYLTHEAWLGDFRFYVDERVIVPRSHIAELLRDGLSPWVADAQGVERVLDLCTGSGCLAILAAHAFPNANVDATELSEDALQVALRNVADYGLGKRVRLLRGDLFEGLGDARYGVIVANPPYVTAQAMAVLPAEYRAEPELALAGGVDGLAVVRRILAQAPSRLTETGVLAVEIGDNRETLEAAYPELEFTWPSLASGGDAVFVVTAAQLSG